VSGLSQQELQQALEDGTISPDQLRLLAFAGNMSAKSILGSTAPSNWDPTDWIDEEVVALAPPEQWAETLRTVALELAKRLSSSDTEALLEAIPIYGPTSSERVAFLFGLNDFPERELAHELRPLRATVESICHLAWAPLEDSYTAQDIVESAAVSLNATIARLIRTAKASSCQPAVVRSLREQWIELAIRHGSGA